MFSRGIFFVFLQLGSLINVAQLVCPVDPPKPYENESCFTQKELNDALNAARNQIAAIESTLTANYQYPGVTMLENEPAFDNFKTQNLDQIDIDEHRNATIVKTAMLALQASQGLTKSQLEACAQSPNLSLSDYCQPRQIDCDPETTNYYTLNGMCNNKLHPTWGAAGTPFIRLFDSAFDDYRAYSRFPSSRSESNTLRDILGFTADKPPGFNNDMTTIMFQLMTHETMKTKKAQLTKDQTGGGYNCCNPNNDTFLAGLIQMNPNCLPVNILPGDSCFGSSLKSLNYIGPNKVLDNCQLTTNPLSKSFESAFIDANLIYNNKSLTNLAANGGKFNLSNIDEMKSCIIDYDDRSRMLPGLFLYLNIFASLNNIIFDKFKAVKPPSFTTAQLMFQTRKFVTAAYQKVFWNMIVSVTADPDSTKVSKFFNCYNPNLNPQVSVENTLTLRGMHQFIGDQLATYPESFFSVQNGLKGRRPTGVNIDSLIENLDLYTKNKCGHTHGLLDNTWNIAGNGPNILCNFFASPNASLGSDLKMMDFQAARDLGEPAYVTILQKLYGVQKCAADFTKTDLLKHDSATQNFLDQHFNGKISDIGLSFGSLLEDRSGNVLGPTASFLIVEQMNRTICGDRFWFSNGFALNANQINVIFNLNLATIICLINNCNGTRIQSDAFLSPSNDNTKKVCKTVDQILNSFNLANW